MSHAKSSDSRRRFAGSPLKLPQMNSGGTVDIDIDHCARSPRSWLRQICFEGPLTPLSSEHDGAFPSFDYPFESGSSDLSTDQIPIRLPFAHCLARTGHPDERQLPPPGLTREGTYDSFDEPLTPLPSDMETDEDESGMSRSVGGTSQGLPKSVDTYSKPHGSLFDAAHACEWFPDLPSVPESEIVVSDFADLRKTFQFPPSAWQLGPDGRLVRNYDVKFESPSVPLCGPVPVKDVVEREMRALMRRREEVRRALELEAGDLAMPGIDVGVLLGDPDRADVGSANEIQLLGPEGTEIYDGVSEYPEEWASNQSTALCCHPTE